MTQPKKATRYAQIIERVFFDNYSSAASEVAFGRDEFDAIAHDLSIDPPKNLGDVIYSFRYRVPLPDTILATATGSNEWIIEGAGKGKYRFRCVPLANIEPTANLAETSVPDATPGIIELYALSDEQALLAKLRYNRLVDVFLGITCSSLQNHLRTTVPGMGQVETDEVYVGLDTRGAHYAIPVQAKGGQDLLSTVQISQDFALCAHLFPDLIALPVAAQFMADDLIALFAFEMQGGHPAISREKHYRLTYGGDLSLDEVRGYQQRPFD